MSPIRTSKARTNVLLQSSHIYRFITNETKTKEEEEEEEKEEEGEGKGRYKGQFFSI